MDKASHDSVPRVLRGQPIVDGGSVRVSVPGAPGAAAAAKAEPAVELLRDEHGVVTAIDVRCACGEHLRLACQYQTESR